MKKIFTLIASLMMVFSMNAATKTIYCKMAQSWWKDSGASVGAYMWTDGGESLAWPGVKMTPVTGETDLWSVEVDTDKYKKIIFTRLNGAGTEFWGAQTNDLTIPTNDNNLYTITQSSAAWSDNGKKCTGSWGTYTPPTEPVIPDYYLTGTLAGGWNANDVKMTYVEASKTYTHTFTAVTVDSEMKFKVTDGTWNNSWGGNNVTPAIDGITADIDGNAVFTLSTAGDVTVTFDGSNIQLTTTGVFKVAVPDRYIAGIGGWDAKQVKMTYNEETKLHEHTFAALAAGDYEFKITDGTWTNSWGKDGQNYPFNLPAAGDVTIKYNWKDNSIELILPEVTEPDPDPTPDPEPVADVTVHFINSVEWAAVACHHWVEGGSGTSWPGDVLSKTDEIAGYDVYTATFTGAHTSCIFNNKDNGKQTGNLTVENGKYYEANTNTWYADKAAAEAALATPIPDETVYFINTGKWSKVMIYTWNGLGATSWPGVEMTKTSEVIGEYEVYSYTAKQGGQANLLFQESADVNKTADLEWQAGKYYAPSKNAWYDTKEDAEGALAGPATVVLHGNFVKADWGDTDAFELSADEKTATLTVLIKAGNYEFGVKLNNVWTSNGKAFTKTNNEHVIEAGSGNLTLNADITGNYVFTWTYETNTLTVTYPTEEVVVETNYYVTGTFNNNEPADANYKMTLEGKVYKATVGLKEGENKLKITDGSWDNTWGYGQLGANYQEVSDPNDFNNILITLDEDKNIVVVFDATAGKITFEGLTVAAPTTISYVLMGVNGDWTNGIPMTVNPDNANEYVLKGQTINEKKDAVKVVTIINGEQKAWCANIDDYSNAIPNYDDMGNLVLEGGVYDFYFKPNEDKIYIEQTVYTRNVTNKYGTICLPYASASTSGAYFYEVVGKGTENGQPAVYLASVNTLKAGVPYIFEKTANTIKVVYSSEKEDTPQNANGLIGNFTHEKVVPTGNYILYSNAFIPADGTTNKVNAYRAYLDLSAVEGDKPDQMPGRRYIGMSVQGENEATGFENIVAPEGQTIKAIVNGQLVIIRGGEMYNVQGQKL